MSSPATSRSENERRVTNPQAPEALRALIENAKIRMREPFEKAFRSNGWILATDGCLIIRIKPDDPDELEDFEPFGSECQKTMDSWRYPIELFKVDHKTLAEWARNDKPLIVPCPECGGDGQVLVDEDPDGDGIEETSVGCYECGGDGVTSGVIAAGWLTSKRMVDRRYVELIVATASESEVIEVRAMAHNPGDGLRFIGKRWDALLMPLRDGATFDDIDIAPPLFTPAQILEGENA